MISVEQLAPGVRFLALPDARFKTAKLTVALYLPLREETASAQALLPYVLCRACRTYPDFSALQLRLSELYGADIVPSVLRVGEQQVLAFSAVSLQDRFALDGEPITAACAGLLRDMLFDPVLENGALRAQDVAQEQRCLEEQIQSEINEKRLYARRRCEVLTCEGEPYAVDRFGTVEGVRAVTPQSLTDTWKRVLREAQVLILYQGDGDGRTAATTLAQAFTAAGTDRLTLPAPVVKGGDGTVNTVCETMDVKQAKLVMGFRTTVAEPSAEVPAMRLLNALWGGTFSSLLFQNVREKLSLCYYCSSSFDRQKGLFLVDSGVEVAKAATAKAEILRQLQQIRDDAFTEEELENARRAIVNQFYEAEDLPGTLSAWYIGQGPADTFRSPAQAAKELEQVTRAQVVALANTVTLCCVYCLSGEEMNSDAL